jgi:urea carboxylase-associated protein 2
MSLSTPTFLWEELVPAGHHWSGLIRRGTVLRLTDIDGGANVSTLLFNPEDKLERYNMADTLKAQHTAFLTTGHVCYSDMGRIFCSIIRDDAGWNDTFCGLSDSAQVQAQYGEANFGQVRNQMYRNGQDSLLIELGKYGLGLRDLVPNINFFSKVSCDENGKLSHHPTHSSAGSVIDLRFEMNTLVMLSTAPHPLNKASEYSPKPVLLSAYRADAVADNDGCRTQCAQNARGFILTERYYAV